jgi:hypothetical protein
MRLRIGYLLNSAPKTLGMPLWNYNKNAAKEVYVAAGKPIHAMFIGSETTYSALGSKVHSCGAPFSFTFAENNNYEVTFQWSPENCEVIVSQIVQTENNWSLSELARFDNKVNEWNRSCLTQFKKMRLY